MPSIYLSAGEASGDKHASMLAKELLGASPRPEIFGMGGGEMASAGVEITQSIERMAVMGFAEVLMSYRVVRKAFADAVKLVRRRRPDIAVLVDYPSFHLRLAKELGELGVPVVIYVAPQVWAWRPGRVRTVAEVARKLLVIFEFELPLFEEAGVDVEFVGHPSMDDIDTRAPGGAARRELSLDAEAPLLAIQPGSRRQVWKYLLPVYVEAVRQVRRVRPEVTAAVGTPDGTPGMFGPGEGTLPPTVKIHDLLRDATAGMFNSGTMSLEAAILGCPGVVGYRMNWFNYQIARQFVELPHVALPNIVLGMSAKAPGTARREPQGRSARRTTTAGAKRPWRLGAPPRLGGTAMRELIQRELTPAAVASEMLSLITYPERREEAKALLREVRERLGPPGASKRAAEAVLDLLS